MKRDEFVSPEKGPAGDDPLQTAASAIEAVGQWREWTLDRQLWYLRLTRGWSQQDLARRAGLRQPLISRLESGADFKFSTLVAVMKALGRQPLLLPDEMGRIRRGRPRRKPLPGRLRGH